LSRLLESTGFEDEDCFPLSAYLIPDLARCGQEQPAIEQACKLLDTNHPDKINIFNRTMGRIVTTIVRAGRLEEALALIEESEWMALLSPGDFQAKSAGEIRLYRSLSDKDAWRMLSEKSFVAYEYTKKRDIEKALSVISGIHNHRYKAKCFFNLANALEEEGDSKSDEYFGKGLLEAGLIMSDIARGFVLSDAAGQRAKAGKYEQAIETVFLIPSPWWRTSAYSRLGQIFIKANRTDYFIQMYNAVIDVEEFPDDECSNRNANIADTLAHFAYIAKLHRYDKSEIMFKEALHYAMLSKDAQDKVLSYCDVSIMMMLCSYADSGASFNRVMALAEKLQPCERSRTLSHITARLAMFSLYEPSLFLLPRVFIRYDYEYALSNIVEYLARDSRRKEAIPLWKGITYYKEKIESLEKIVEAMVRDGEVAEAMNMLNGNENEKYRQVILKGIIENLHLLNVS